MLNFCTLFDSKFLPYGLNLHQSLLKNCESFHLYIFAFDDTCYEILTHLHLAHTTVIPLAEFEDEELLAVKPTRSKAEYCWTATPSTVLYCLTKYKLYNCTYLDADIYFFDDPSKLIDEMGTNEILLTLHNYTPRYDQTTLSGKFCVQFMTFLDTSESLAALNWWRAACLDWCYARAEDGKFGDQKYLDDWETRFQKVHVLQNPGGAVAPWNIQQYEVQPAKEGIEVAIRGNRSTLNFYHFHGLRFLTENKVNLCEYKLSADVIKYIYVPYIRQYMRHYKQLMAIDSSLNMLLPVRFNIKNIKNQTYSILTGRYINNVYAIDKLLNNG